MPKCKKCKRDLAGDWIWCPWCGRKQTSIPRKTIKRENGTGSVYKRTDLKVRPWIAATPSKGERGKQAPPQIIGHYETAQEAKDAVDEFRRNPTTKLNIALKELYEEWKPAALDGKSQKLIYGYDESFEKLELLHNERFRDLRTAQFQNIINRLKKEQRPKLDALGNQRVKDGQPQFWPPLQYSALAKIKVLLGLLYAYAMKNDIVHKNYAEFIDLPKKPKGVKDCFSDLEVKKIENAVGKVPFADCVLVMCYTGPRISEFVGLNKFGLHKIGDIWAFYGGIKTDAGENKVVPIHPKIKNIVAEWDDKNGDAIFCRPDGKKYSAKYFREKCYYPSLEQIGVRHLSPHACRRTFATMMDTNGVREEDLIAMMGHTDISVDIEHYIVQSAEKLYPSIAKLP